MSKSVREISQRTMIVLAVVWVLLLMTAPRFVMNVAAQVLG